MSKVVTTTELIKLLQISGSTFKRRYTEIVEDYLPYFWNFKVSYKGRSVLYNVEEEYGELQPLPRKTKNIKDFYVQKTDKIIESNPWNTGSNIARWVVATDNKFNHKEGTAANYIRPILKEEYNLSDERRWSEIDYEKYTYEPITQEQEKYLKELFEKYLGGEQIGNIIAERDAGYISKEQAYDKMEGNYNDAMKAFKEKYGFRPIKIGKYEKKAF